MAMLYHLLSVVVNALLTTAGAVQEGGLCSAENDHLDPNTFKFLSECTDQTFCSEPINGTCVPRQCRRDEFPFGYNLGVYIPPFCKPGTFCPDEGSGCKPLASIGQPCQLNRDEQCAPPLDWQELASSQNFNGSICMQSICMYANVTLGSPCVIDNVTYTVVGPNGQQYQQAFVRDNCRTPHLYCDSSMLCQRTKSIGVTCLTDQECETYNCGIKGACEAPPETPLKVAPWQYALTGICISTAMTAICVMLTLVHKRYRLEHYRSIRDYYYEQLDLRQSIIALHATAADRYDAQAAKLHS